MPVEDFTESFRSFLTFVLFYFESLGADPNPPALQAGAITVSANSQKTISLLTHDS
jgi:hypothetical protein